MAISYEPETAHASEWKLWPGRENVTLRIQRDIGIYDSYPLTATGGAAKRRVISWKELEASAGAYTNQDRAWLLPLANLPANLQPKPGDQVRDSDDVDWTIGDMQVGKFGLTYRCVARALAVVHELAELGQLKRPAEAKDSAGRAALATYSAVGSQVRCRVQPEDGSIEEVFERMTIPRRYRAFLETPLTVKAHDQFVVGSTKYTVKGFRNAERIWDLMSLQLESIA